MKARSTKAGVAILALALLLAMAAPAMAATSVTVNAEVDVNPYSIVLDDGASLDYWTMDLGTAGTPFWGTRVMVRNNGGLAARLDVVGTDASNGSGGAWELDPMASGPNQFSWTLSSGWGSAAVNDDATSLLVGGTGLSPGDTAWFDATLYMPTSTTGYGTYSWSGAIYASAP